MNAVLASLVKRVVVVCAPDSSLDPRIWMDLDRQIYLHEVLKGHVAFTDKEAAHTDRLASKDQYS
jgi:hypothetical protein